MTEDRSLSQFDVVKESPREGLTQPPCHEAMPIAAANDVNEQPNKDSEDVAFCGEPFADNGELLSSLSPLLFSMKLFGLYFHRQDRRRRPTDDPEWNQATATTGRAWNKLRVYATVVLVILWLNTVRFAWVFTSSDHFGATLLLKIALFTWCVLIAIFQTTYYYASHTGKLLNVLTTLPVTRDCIRKTHRAAVSLITAVVWITLVGDIAGAAYVFFKSDEEYNFILAPFVTYIYVPQDNITVAKTIAYILYILLFPSFFFSHSMSLVLVYIFYSQFRALKKNFRRFLGEGGQFSGDLSWFRRRHQTLSRAVRKVDGFMRLSNVAGFVCHISNIIVLLYSIVFYPESTSTYRSRLTYWFWMLGNINGLLFSASAGVIVNHMVRMCVFTACLHFSNKTCF